MKINSPKATVSTLAVGIAALAGSSAMADSVISDDLVVIGSGCVGIDCSINMSFNDELVLRENNTRIAFGSAGQFRLTANESSNGGANEFRIDSIQPPQNLTDESAEIVFGGLTALSGAVEQGDGTLIVPIEALAGRVSLVNAPNGTDSTTTFTPGQSVILPAGSWTQLGSTSFYDLTDNVAITSTAPSGGFSAQVTGAAESLIAFSDTGNMVTLGMNSEYVAGAMSVGNSTTRRQVTGVADAVAADEVINIGQLNRAMTIPTAGLSNRIQSESARLDGVSATTAAMSALQANPRGRSPLAISLGFGNYEGETAAAMGVLWRMSDTSHIQFSLAGSQETTPQTSVSFKIAW